jgi:L-idonate 5-dehydrogenase
MQGVVIHAARDLRIEDVASVPPGAGEVRVEIKAGGICGSDLHYYQDGGFGTVRVREPMALGHEIAGVIAAVGEGVTGLRPGQKVAVDPSRPCGTCDYCRAGTPRHCRTMRFMGSAMRFPHVQGGFRQSVTVPAFQAVPVADSLSLGEAAMAEPLAVCLHAAAQAGPLLGKRVLVTGCGPIGAICVAVAAAAGAASVTATDVVDAPLATAKTMGASHTVNVARTKDALAQIVEAEGRFDVLFEASGNVAALVGALDLLHPGGVVVQVGIGKEAPLPLNLIVARELQIRGTFRFDREFQLAVEMMNTRRIDLSALISATFPFEKAVEAFEHAGDRSAAMKVQLAF